MTQQTINIGASANDGTGDTPRAAFNKVNQNFTELYGGFLATVATQALARTALGYGSVALLNSVSLTTNISGILPVANGGTGTASPGLVAGTGVTITGSWPNQTINATGGGSGFTGTYDSGTLTTSTPITFTQTWNAAVTFSGFEIDITDTGSIANATSLPFQVNRNGSPLMSVTKFGVFQTVVYQVGTDINNPYMKMYGGSGLGLRAELPIAWGNGTPGGGEVGSVLDTYIRRRAAAKLQLGDVDAAAPVAQTLTVQSVVAGTSNTAGANLTVQGSAGTGTGAGGSIIFQVAPAGSTGTAQNAFATAMTIGSDKSVTISGSGGYGNNMLNFGSQAGAGFYGGAGGLNVAVGTGVPMNISNAAVTLAGPPLAFAAIAGSGDLFLTRRAAAQLLLGAADAAAPIAQTLTVQSVVAGTTNTAGADFTIQGSLSTGSVAGGALILKTAAAGASGTAQNTTPALPTMNQGDIVMVPGSGFISMPYSTMQWSGFLRMSASAYRWTWAITGADFMFFDLKGINFGTTNGFVNWGAVIGTNDVAIGRNANGVVEINNATASSSSLSNLRDLKLRNLIFSDGTQLATSPARALLTTITPTAVASIAYTSIPSGYSKFEIEFDNVTNANGGANEAPLIALSANNGTTYDSSQVGAANTGLSGAMYGRVSIAPVNVTSNKIAEGAATQGTVYWQLAGKWTSQTGVTNAIRFAWSGGSNFVAQGAIRIYGIV